jgi:hypothetical protein
MNAPASNLRIKIAISNAAKFNTRAFADARAIDQKYWVDVLQGDGGLFWVPATRREQSILVALGYQVAR